MAAAVDQAAALERLAMTEGAAQLAVHPVAGALLVAGAPPVVGRLGAVGDAEASAAAMVGTAGTGPALCTRRPLQRRVSKR